ncbi:hypothetical protein HYFRA_00013384 [Hymenoscyphus fraxineus]|uniref:Uncharacterized protein n=1 Tax=Hymenoscyphus fraxineus TaxID=746836 RepID=A0A9N9PUS0_9HELO|nr:hypothetical protein HYFRA_00013384 [Hymenoscyphus fraxineus]
MAGTTLSEFAMPVSRFGHVYEQNDSKLRGQVLGRQDEMEKSCAGDEAIWLSMLRVVHFGSMAGRLLLGQKEE